MGIQTTGGVKPRFDDGESLFACASSGQAVCPTSRLHRPCSGIQQTRRPGITSQGSSLVCTSRQNVVPPRFPRLPSPPRRRPLSLLLAAHVWISVCCPYLPPVSYLGDPSVIYPSTPCMRPNSVPVSPTKSGKHGHEAYHVAEVAAQEVPAFVAPLADIVVVFTGRRFRRVFLSCFRALQEGARVARAAGVRPNANTRFSILRQ